MVSALAILLMLLVVRLRHTVGPGYVGLALLNVMGFGQSLSWIVRQWTDLETSIGDISRLKTFSETPCENLDNEIQTVPDNWPSRCEIQTKHFSAAYTPDGTLFSKTSTCTSHQVRRSGSAVEVEAGKALFS